MHLVKARRPLIDLHLAHATSAWWRAHVRRLSALLVLAVAAYGARESLALGLGEATRPGPGLWPFILCLFTASAAVVLLFIDPESDYEAWTKRSLRIAVGLVALGAFISAFAQIGFIIPAACLMLFWLRAFAAEPWRLAVPVAVGTAVCLRLVFVVALGVPFPAEPFGTGF